MANSKPVPDEHRIHRVRYRHPSFGTAELVLLLIRLITPFQLTDWSSHDRRHHHKFLSDTVEYVDQHPKPLHPVLKEFQDEVEKSTRLSMLFDLMFQQVSTCVSIRV